MKVKVGEDTLVKIYELRDPRDIKCEPRYVGITIRPEQIRLIGHLTPCSLKTKTHKNNWIKGLLADGVKPTLHIIEEVTGWKYACSVEQYWIKEFRKQGYNLTNSTDGGEGSIGIVPREETRAKLRISSSGKNNPMYGRCGELSPTWGRKDSQETIDTRKASVREAKKTTEINNDGIYKCKSTGNWEALIWFDGKKINLGTYHNREDALKVRKIVVTEKYNNPLLSKDKIKDLIKEFVEAEYFYKLNKKEPNVKFNKRLNRWVPKLIYNGNSGYLGIYKTKEEAIEVWTMERYKILNKILNNEENTKTI